MSDSEQERTHQPTSARRNRAAEEGRVPQSQEVTSASAFLVVVALLWGASDRIAAFLEQMFVAQTNFARQRLLQPELSMENLRQSLFQLFTMLVPAAALVMCCVWSIHLVQRQFAVRLSVLRPDLGRLSAATRFQQVFSLRSGWLQFEKLLKFSILAGILTMVVYFQLDRIWNLMQLDLGVAVAAAWGVVIQIMWIASGILFSIAILDYGLQRWRFELSLRMTDDEIREEARAAQRGK